MLLDKCILIRKDFSTLPPMPLRTASESNFFHPNRAFLFYFLKIIIIFNVYCIYSAMPGFRRRQWHPTPVLLPGKSHGQRSLVGCNPWGHYQLDTSLSLFTFMHWRRKWQPTPVFLPGESQGQGSLVGRRLWGRTESDTTEAT